jgi:hypothetical protein
VSVVDRGEPVAPCSEWHGDGTAGEDDRASHMTAVAPAEPMGEASPRQPRLVGKSPQAARQVSLCGRLLPEEFQLVIVGIPEGDQMILDPGVGDAQRSQPLLPP